RLRGARAENVLEQRKAHAVAHVALRADGLPPERLVAADDAFDAGIVKALPDVEPVDVAAQRIDSAFAGDEEALEKTLARLGRRFDDEILVRDADPLRELARNGRIVPRNAG